MTSEISTRLSKLQDIQCGIYLVQGIQFNYSNQTLVTYNIDKTFN